MTIEHTPTLASVLSPFPYHISGSASINEAKTLMQAHDIHHLIVMNDGDVHGLISDRDIQHHAVLYEKIDDSEIKVNDICTNNAVMADIHDPLAKVLEAMTQKHIDSVIILRDGELAGIFTTSDACHHFAKLLNQINDKKNIPDILA